MKNQLVVGLIIYTDRLLQIRKSRLLVLNEKNDTSYTDIVAIKEELNEARRFFQKNNWKTIDVTRKSVEETTANIMQLYSEHKKELE